MVLWSDSQVVLHWIHSARKLPTFVVNRVKYIKETNFSDVKYCPTGDNPADLLTRGISTAELISSELWMNGPPWLTTGDWPICHLHDEKILSCQSESINDEHHSHVNSTHCDNTEKQGISCVIDIKRFSKLEKLLRVTAYVLRFIKTTKKQMFETKAFISVPELNEARKLWIKSTQREVYSQELQHLQNKTKGKACLVRQLKLFTDDQGLIRCGGRLHNASVKYETKHPILLPKKHHFTRLVVTWAHKLVLHAGQETTVSFVRDMFWIPQIRQIVKSVIRSCVPCRKVNGKSYKTPETPPLPKCRLEEAPPFTVTGVDFTGALHYKNADNTISKAYICLFTCGVTRAIHLEVVMNMTTLSFLHAFRRFTARRSLPSHMISDNGTTFIKAAEEIKTICEDSQLHDYLAGRNVQWTFIPKRAPWFGGFYERMVGVTKTVLKKILGKRMLSWDELNTIVVETEAVVNDRPITYAAAYHDELIPLSPSMLLHGRPMSTLPYLDVSKEDLEDTDYGNSESVLQDRSRKMDELSKELWRRWKEEYLPTLREFHINNANRQKGGTTNTIKEGDVVLVHEDNKKKVMWPLAVVTKLKVGNDGLVRSAEIRMKGGTSNRPITKLYPLEICSHNGIQPSDDETQTHDQLTVDTKTDRPKRRAADKARSVIKHWSDLLK